MNGAVVTGLVSLIGSEPAVHSAAPGLGAVGIDNDMRSHFFGAKDSTAWYAERPSVALGRGYTHLIPDVRAGGAPLSFSVDTVRAIRMVIHAFVGTRTIGPPKPISWALISMSQAPRTSCSA